MTNIKPLDSIAKIFLSTDRYREWMMQLNQFGDYVFGTDAHCLIKAPKDMFEKEYVPHGKTANFDNLYSNYKYNEKEIILSSNEIKQILSKIEKVVDSIECSECSGDGTVTCEYDHEHDCPDCDGTGIIANDRLPKIFPKEDNYIQIIDSYLSPYYVNKIVQVCDYLETDTIRLASYGKLKVHIFRVDIVEIVLMPIYTENQPDFGEKTKHKLV